MQGLEAPAGTVTSASTSAGPSTQPPMPHRRRNSSFASTSTSKLGAKSADHPKRTHRGLTCANCRARKTRCDGTMPGCKTCEVYKDTCRYEKPPPMSQVIALAQRLQEAEATILSLKAEIASKSSASPSSASAFFPGSGSPIEAAVSRAGTSTTETPPISLALMSNQVRNDPGHGLLRDGRQLGYSPSQNTPFPGLRQTDARGVGLFGAQARDTRPGGPGDGPRSRPEQSSEPLMSDLSLDEHGRVGQPSTSVKDLC
jgi:hypothetical protein